MWPTKELTPLLTPRLNKYIREDPTDKQAALLLCNDLEVFWGGAGGGGKSSALLMAALQYFDIHGYASLILRRTFTDLSQPGALLDRARLWLSNTGASWDGMNKQWRSPEGGVLQFGYLENPGDEDRYRSAEYQCICIDEASQFEERQFLFMFSRLRRKVEVPIPLRMRLASNPGGPGHMWLKKRYIEKETRERGALYIPASLHENPHIDRESYIKALMHLAPIDRERILNGDWLISDSGRIFRPEWFKTIDVIPINLLKVRYWDLAATEPAKGKDPDWTAGVLMGRDAANQYYILDVRRLRASPLEVESFIRMTAEQDGKDTDVWMEQEPGASGVSLADHYARNVLAGFYFHPNRVSGNKRLRASPLASMAQSGNVFLYRAPSNRDFLNELEIFPDGEHDDMVDSVSGAFEKLVERQWDSWYTSFGKPLENRMPNRDPIGEEDATPNVLEGFHLKDPFER